MYLVISLQNEKKKVKAERLFKNKKWKEAAELYYDVRKVSEKSF